MKRQLVKGDVIMARGIKAVIDTIDFQEPWSWRKSYYLEFTDTNGVYRSWKQEIDGGTAYDNNGVEIADIDGVQEFLEWGRSMHGYYYLQYIDSNSDYIEKSFVTRLELRQFVMDNGGILANIAYIDD